MTANVERALELLGEVRDMLGAERLDVTAIGASNAAFGAAVAAGADLQQLSFDEVVDLGNDQVQLELVRERGPRR